MPRLSKARGIARLLLDEAGATAAEFALVIPLLVIATIGTINAGIMMYAISTLHYAAEDAARCGAINTTTCGSPTAVQTYAVGRYKGPAMGASFTASAGANCYTVSATATYTFVTGFTSTSVPMSATACYPLQPA